MKPSSSVNTVTELDFLLTPNTWNWTEYRPVPEQGCEETQASVSWRPSYLAVHGESHLCSLACLQEFGSCHAMLVDLVRHRAPSRHVILFTGIRSSHTVGKRAEHMTRQWF